APNVVSWGCVRRDGANAASAEPRVPSEVVAVNATGRDNGWSLKIRYCESGLWVQVPPRHWEHHSGFQWRVSAGPRPFGTLHVLFTCYRPRRSALFRAPGSTG